MYVSYCSVWVVLNLLFLPMTFGLGVLRLGWGIMGEVVGGVKDVVLGVNSVKGVSGVGRINYGVSRKASKSQNSDNRKERKGHIRGRSPDKSKVWEVKEDEFLFVDLD